MIEIDQPKSSVHTQIIAEKIIFSGRAGIDRPIIKKPLTISWQKSPKQTVESLLHWSSRVSPLRENEEWHELLTWANESEGICVKCLYGEGGVGKTRLAMELGDRLRKQGWSAGSVTDFSQSQSFDLGQSGTLLIIDYPERYGADLKVLLEDLNKLEQPDKPLLLLLLSRHEGYLEKLLDDTSCGRLLESSLKLSPLKNQGWHLFEAAYRRMSVIKKRRDTVLPLSEAQFYDWQSRDELNKRPLIILSLAWVLTEEYTNHCVDWRATELVKKLVNIEIRRIKQEAKNQGLSEKSIENLILFKAMAAISQGIDTHQINQLKNSVHLGSIDLSIDDWRKTSLYEEDPMNRVYKILPMKPDILAAALLSHVFDEQYKNGVTQQAYWIYACLTLNESVEQSLADYARLYYDAHRVLKLYWPEGCLEQLIESSNEYAKTLESSLARKNLEIVLKPLSISVQKKLLENTDIAPDEQARLLSNLSILLAETGDRAGGLQAIQRSVEIREELYQQNPAAYAPDLALSLSNLSIRLAETGNRAGGLQAIQRSVELYEGLYQQNPVAYAPDLARSLTNLSIRLAETGDRAGGLQAIQRSVELYEGLYQQNPAAYAPDLARSLTNLSNRLAETGDRADGLQAIQRSVELYEELYQQNPAAYAPDLALSLSNLSIRLAETGNRAGGLQAIQRSVELYEGLYQQNPVAYAPDLARSLTNLSIRLAETGDRAGGLQAIQRSVELYEELYQQNPAAYAPDLALSLSNLSISLAETGDRAGDLQAIQRSVELYEELYQQNPAAYAPDLASSLIIEVYINEGNKPDKRNSWVHQLNRAITLLEPYAIEGTQNKVYLDWAYELKRVD